MSDGQATADMELSTSDTAVPAREEQTHVPESAGATLIQDGSTQGNDPAAGQTFVVNSESPPRNGQGAATLEAQTLIAPPDENGAAGDFGATVVADGTTGDDGADYRFGATVVDHTAAADSDGFQMGATLVGGDDPAVRATRMADAVSSFDPSRPGDELDLQPGESLIGRFRVLKVLGEGSFGAVYLAEDPQLDRRVAIKVTKVGVLTTRSDVDRFQREAKAAAQLRHPNIVPVYEVGRIGRSSFLAYEYIEGRTLGSRLKEEKKLPSQTAAQLMLAISSALGYAHELGIIHRDMKPDNVLLDRQGQPHIADFGLARRDSGEMDKTREGGLMGTPLYMSPEQASGRSHEADARSDVWSLGVMLRELLTGVLPFQGKLTEILIGIQTVEPPSIRALDPSLAKDLETICQKCLSKDPAQRYANGTELAEELDRFLRGEPIKARPLSLPARTVRWVKRNPQGAAVMATLLCAAVVSTWSVILANQEQTRRAIALSQELTSAVASNVPDVIEKLQLDRDIVAAPLLQNVSLADRSSAARNRLLLATAALYPDAAADAVSFDEVADTLVTLPADEMAMQVGLLLANRQAVVPRLRRIADDKDDLQSSRMALYALAKLADAELSSADVANAAAGLLAVNARDLTAILGLIEPIRERIGPELERTFHETQSGVQAAGVLAELYRDQPEKLFALALLATPQQLQPLITALSAHGDVVAELARRELSRGAVGGTIPTDQLRARTNAFVVLYAVAPRSVEWGVLAGGADNSLRTEIVAAVPQAVPRWRPVADRLGQESNAEVRQALLLILAAYPVSNLLPEDRTRLQQHALQLYDSDPSPAVHAAARWFLEQTGGKAEVEQAAAAPLTLADRGERDWFRNSQGQEFAIVNGPVEFLMGAQPDDEEKNFDDREHQHLRRIPRSFAIGQREVTVTEFLAYDRQHFYEAALSPEPLCPVTSVSWIDAAKYCRWLSEQEGVPEEEMVFPPVGQIEPHMPLPADALDRTGYRLPTAAEWEFACRAGTTTSRPFGQPDRIGSFAWFNQNSDNRTWPVGSKMPNGLGTFDMLGNVWEWCQDWYFDKYPTAPDGAAVVDGADPREGFEREGRGGSYADGIAQLRTPDRDNPLPDDKIFYFGFRLARTVRQ